MNLSNRYNPAETEEKWYTYWKENKCFRSTPDDREPFTIVIPPPNVTGILHMGHMLNNTIQDIFIRKARLEGKNACWVPGTDHASIATEAKVVRMLREKGIKKSDLSREEFLEHAWEWTHKYGGIIFSQLEKLGASCDWDRAVFTMDEQRYKSVIKVFVDLYKKNKLYRDYRMVNWDPVAQTVLSNEEVIYGEENSRLYYVRYKVEGTEDEWVTIATVRPETIMGDTAVAINPKDERFTHLHGKRVIVPLVERSVPIIKYEYVDIEFGTGCLKVTPAHDPNDFEIGKRHNLETVDVLNDDGTMSEAAQFFVGEDREKARKMTYKELEARGHLVKVEDYRNNVGRSERTNAVVEPKLSLQWYVDMKKLASPALDSVMKDEIEFFPKKYKNTYNHWMSNIRDWCISRQLWWGQRIPAYYLGEEVFVAETPEEALAEARQKTGNADLQMSDLKQDDDVLDTWFSSWLWPISVFDGYHTREELDYYYPTNVLVTGWDIIFLWVARMAMAGYEWEGKRPFHQVYFTGMVRDEKGRKMSKQLGNSPDPLDLMKEYGADGVRFGMMSCAPAGNDLLFNISLVEQGRNFCNKIWNALRLVKSWEVTDDTPDAETQAVHNLTIAWFENKFNETVAALGKDYEQFRLSDVVMKLYSFIWSDFCSWYLESIKPPYGQPISKATRDKTLDFFERLMTLLHPCMPFITEEVWHQLKDRAKGEDCIFSTYPAAGDFDKNLIQNFEILKEMVTNIRNARNKHGISPKEALPFFAQRSEGTEALAGFGGFKETVSKMANLSSFDLSDGEPENGIPFMVGTHKFYTQIKVEIDVAAEKEKLTTEIKRLQGMQTGLEKKLSNERFVNNAPEAVVAKEKKKLADTKEKIVQLEESLGRLG